MPFQGVFPPGECVLAVQDVRSLSSVSSSSVPLSSGKAGSEPQDCAGASSLRWPVGLLSLQLRPWLSCEWGFSTLGAALYSPGSLREGNWGKTPSQEAQAGVLNRNIFWKEKSEIRVASENSKGLPRLVSVVGVSSWAGHMKHVKVLGSVGLGENSQACKPLCVK